MGKLKQKASIEIDYQEAHLLYNLISNSEICANLKEQIRNLSAFNGEIQLTIINKNLSRLNKVKDE